MKKFNRRGLAALLGGTLVVAGIILPATAEAASAPAEVKTIPGDSYLGYETDLLTFAGATGYLHQRANGSPWLWTRYADRRTTVVDRLRTRTATSIFPTGDGDTVFLTGASSGETFDLGTMTSRPIPDVPDNPIDARVLGDSLIAVRAGSVAYTVKLYRLGADGSTTPVPVRDAPENLKGAVVMAGDAKTAVLRLMPPTGVQFALLDLASGQVTMLPKGSAAATRVVLTDDRVGLLTPSLVLTYSRAGVRDGTDTAEDRFTLSPSVPVSRMGLVGEDLIAGPGDSSPGPLLRYTPDNAPDEVVPIAAASVVAQSSDSVLFVGGTGPSDWSVRRATSTGQTVVAPLHLLANAGVTLSSGVLRHIEALVRPGEAALYSHHGFEFAPDSTGDAPGAQDGSLRAPPPCQTGAACVRTVDGSSLGTVYLGMYDSKLRVFTTTGSDMDMRTFTSTGGTVVDASPNYRIVNGTNPDQQYILESLRSSPLATRPVTGAGLWLDSLWSTTRPGYLQPKDLQAGTLGAEIATGSACAASEIQATANHVYWSCGRSGPSGVYVLAQHKNISLPGGHYLLGDNYLVRHDADGVLLRYDVSGGTLGEPVSLGTFPRGDLNDDRNISWAVDKFGGDVAWVDSANTTHIVDPGVAPAPLTSLPDRPSENQDISPGLHVTVPLARPVSATSFAVKELRTGTVVTSSSGPTRTMAIGVWDGKIAGKPAMRGDYQWSLSATVDGVSTRVTGGAFWVSCGGTPPLHSYDCNGLPTILGLTSAATGAARWVSVQPGGTSLIDAGSPETLKPITGVVPFGDITKDLRNDLLIRRSDGSLLSFRGNDYLPFSGGTLAAVPGNWNRWDALVHTGDLTGDGQSDLITRDRATGGLYRIDGDGKGSFKTPVLWATGYKGYTRFVGPGDINGDGKADLLLFIGTDMYAKYGDGKGGLGDRRLVGSGFLGYNAIVGAGDVNEDGKNDLLLRDTAGNLYRRLGDGKGNFGNRLLVGVGYQKFASIY